MKHEIQIFSNEAFSDVRTIMIDGIPWFAATDVTRILGYKNCCKAIADHVDEDDKGITKCATAGGMQNLTVINESGVYSLIISSKMLEAKRFKRWVTHEILPSLRKTGAYAVNDEAVVRRMFPCSDEKTIAELTDILKMLRMKSE